MAQIKFLKALAAPAPRRSLQTGTRGYRSMLGIWLIDLALLFEWYRPKRSGRWRGIFTDEDFCLLTGVQNRSLCESDGDDDEEDAGPMPTRAPSAAACRRILLRQRALLQGEKLSQKLPLFANVATLATVLGLTDADQALLTFAAAMQLFPQFKSAIASRSEVVTDQLLCQALERLTQIPASDFAASIGEEGMLGAASLVAVTRCPIDLENKLDLMDGFGSALMTTHSSSDALVARFLRRASKTTLNLDNFPHLCCDSDALTLYLRNAIATGSAGVNVLMHGKPGVGKTEFAQALADEVGADLYEIAFCDGDGNPIKGEARLRAYNLCQRILARSGNALLLFDEVEDVFPGGFGFLSHFFGDDDAEIGGQTAGKAWINRTMERNPVPALWISNRIGQIDAAYRRRFDYSVPFPAPPKPVRRDIAQHHLGEFDPPLPFLEGIASNEEITPAQLAIAAKVARIACPADKARALQVAEQTLERSIALLGQKATRSVNRLGATYSLAYLNTDSDIDAILAGLRRRPRGSFCFYGAAGTGKSELARHLAEQIGAPVLLRRASDLLSKYVGDSEKNIATMFVEARQQNAVLVLDEADSFLADRRDAQRSWEVTQVNELLTQMEAFDGIFICTTNLMDKLDPASLRRFAFKVRFDPLRSEQRWALFQQELARLGGGLTDGKVVESSVRGLSGLTPGDFAVAARQFELWDTPATSGRLYDLLRKECEAKGAGQGRIGFGRKGG